MAEGEPKGPSVPKFASFRPKPPSTAEKPDRGEETVRSRSPSKDNSSRFQRHSKYYRSRRSAHTKDSHHRHRHSETVSSQKAVTSAPGDQDSRNDRHEQNYAIDVRGDDDNLRYGSLHRYNVPPYRRVGYGTILGLSPWQKIDRESSSDKMIVLSSDDHLLGRSRRLLYKARNKDQELRIKPGLLGQPAAADTDFLPLSVTTHEGGSDSETSNQDDDSHYRSIHGKAKSPTHPEDHDLEYSHTAPIHSTSVSSQSAETTFKAARRVEDNPSDGQAWLNLVQHQADQFGEHVTKDEAISIADLKLSIIEKALRAVKDDQHRELLLQLLMEQANKLWDTAKVMNKWSDVLSENPRYLLLWTQYIDFLQTSFQNFRFEDLRETFVKALKILVEAKSRHKNYGEGLAHSLAYVLLRSTLCMREAGFVEQSFAIWQANLEFNFCRPDAPFSQSSTSFEDFWESEVPRIGEVGSLTWKGYFEKGGAAPPLREDTLVNVPENQPLSTWYRLERQAEECNWPARSSDDTAEDDPFRVILFSDISPFLVDFESSGQQQLLQAFLAYSGLPPCLDFGTKEDSWWWDSFTRNGKLYGAPHSHTSAEGVSMALLRVEYFRLSPHTLFAKPETWFSAFPTEMEDKEASFVQRALMSLVNGPIGIENLSEYVLSYELANNPDSARKSAKKMLKQNPSNLKLYNAYALIEFRRDNRLAAETALATAINMSKNDPDTALLWETWIWELLEADGPQNAFLRLITMSNEHSQLQVAIERKGSSEVDKTAKIRLYRLLKSSRDHCITTGAYSLVICYVTLHILHSYVSSGGDISLALDTFDQNLQLLPLPVHSSYRELFHQSMARLIHYHTRSSRSYSPRNIRKFFQSAISIFPQNSIIFELLTRHESKFRIDDQIRATVSAMMKTTKAQESNPQSKETVLTHIYSIYSELSRTTEFSSNEHSIRAAFERAVTSECGGKSVLIWKSYTLWERWRGALETTATSSASVSAKNVWWRSIRACPWAKGLWTMPWEIEGLVKEEELRGIYELMRDKEIRVRVVIEV